MKRVATLALVVMSVVAFTSAINAPEAQAGSCTGGVICGSARNNLPSRYTMRIADQGGNSRCDVTGEGWRYCTSHNLGAGQRSGYFEDVDMFTVTQSNYRVRHEGGQTHWFTAGRYYRIHDNEYVRCWADASGPYCYVDRFPWG